MIDVGTDQTVQKHTGLHTSVSTSLFSSLAVANSTHYWTQRKCHVVAHVQPPAPRLKRSDKVKWQLSNPEPVRRLNPVPGSVPARGGGAGARAGSGRAAGLQRGHGKHHNVFLRKQLQAIKDQLPRQ